MREHALPQDVTGYKFHIIGNMTLKQFAEVAVGVVIGVILYRTNLYPVVKFPLIALFAGGGAMIAFVPIEERPLDQWITAFFRALYRPTQYYWKRMTKIPEPFLYEPRTELKTVVADVDLTPARRQRVKEYLSSINKDEQSVDQLETFAEQRLNEVMSVFGTPSQPALAYASDEPTTEPTDVNAILNASPDTVSEAVDNLSFTGRATTEEPVIENGPSTEEVEMSNNVLRLFDTTTPVEDTVPSSDFVPFEAPVQPEIPEPAPQPEPVAQPDIIPQNVDVSLSPVSETPAPTEMPQTSSVAEVIPAVDLSPSTTSTVEIPAESAAVPEDLTSIPDVSLQPDETQAAPAELPQITTVFDAPSETVPTVSVQTAPKYELKPVAKSADSSDVAQVADVIAMNANQQSHRTRTKNTVTFKSNRTSDSDKFQTILPHIIDMTGDSKTVEVEQPKPVAQKSVNVPKEVTVPEVEEIRVERTVKAPEETQTATETTQMSTAVDPSLLQLPENKNVVQATSQVTFNTNLPFPEKPTKPNKVVGMVIDQAGSPLPNTIVEILTPDGIPARAVKTNPLGQFFIATPLNPGDYMITAEKEGLKFTTQQLAVTNKIIDPIEIRAS